MARLKANADLGAVIFINRLLRQDDKSGYIAVISADIRDHRR